MVLDVSNLSVQIRGKAGVIHPVDDVSFSLRPGETLGLVGESGSGKSMTGLALMRLLPQPAARITQGRITLAGQDILAFSDRQMRSVRGRDISMILQDPQTSLNPVWRIGAQVIEALRLHAPGPSTALRVRAVELLRWLGIPAPEARMRAFPHELSGGMRQRVVGAIALSSAPKVLIADEPTTALDVTIQAQFLRLLRDIQAETGLSILFITHDFGVVARLCHRVMVMYAGRVVETGPVRRIFSAPAHPYTRALVASVPRLDTPEGRLPAIPGQPPALWSLPSGCAFAPRCPLADARCHLKAPPTVVTAPGQSAACWRPVA
ncbi:ABC transporter ATP-binding protein [Pararhodobacter sp. SW119]|uniref:ABC transporter ATP-binding protein n=1 Tax=Pararhodobacter sp. SW119 TaxID=2780075 RepID=UPI001ADFD2D4|nr:ABC transporter ATP-binding protein [Pararhodobacter sp. SW119]